MPPETTRTFLERLISKFDDGIYILKGTFTMVGDSRDLHDFQTGTYPREDLGPLFR